MQQLRDKVLQYIRMNGPVLPVQVAKAIQTDITFAGAILSELIGKKEVMISNSKIGGSPVYYVLGQEYKLQMLEKHLGGKEKEAYKLIRDKRVVRDNELEPWQRVALRELKDFAVPLNVKIKENAEIFWKWYLLNDNDAKSLVKNILQSKIEEQKEILEQKEVVKELLELKKEPEKIIEQKQEIKQEQKKLIKQEPLKKKEDIIQEKIISDNAYDFVMKYFKIKRINVIEQETIKKNKEFDFITEIPSGVGSLKYYVKFKDKKRINEADISLAYLKGQNKRLPIIFLSNGELTKKAKEYLDKELKGQLNFRKI